MPVIMALVMQNRRSSCYVRWSLGLHERSHTPSRPPEILILEGAVNNLRAVLLCVLRFTKRKEIHTPQGRTGGDNKVDVTSGWLALQRHKADNRPRLISTHQHLRF